MTRDVHIYRAGFQPFLHFRDADGRMIRRHPRRIVRCHECRDLRWAKNLKVQAYYDGWNIVCADGCYGWRKA